MVRDTDNLHFSADMPHRFFKVAAWQSTGARAAIRGSPARQCTDHPWICAMQKPSADERGSIHTRLKTGIDCRVLTVMLLLRLYPMASHFVTCIHACVESYRLLLYVRRRQFRFYSIMNVVSARKATVDRCTALTVTLTPSLLLLYVRISLKP